LVRFLGEQKMNKEEMIVPLWRDLGGVKVVSIFIPPKFKFIMIFMFNGALPQTPVTFLS
jgi:hypothetical protein